jgi:pimeloyl-ACP methyl ester carboxylesterase
MLDGCLPTTRRSSRPTGESASRAFRRTRRRRTPLRFRRVCSFLICLIAFSFCIADPICAQVAFTEDNGPYHTLGPAAATGAVIWSHGRSLIVEDSKSPTPGYIETFRTQGWDAFRFNRKRDRDSLPAGSLSLAWFAGILKARGYRTVVLAGQSYGAFMSLMAADISTDVDAVVAVAPAAFGPVQDNPQMGALNASRLYPVLERVRRARVMLFYFRGDMFDPGGRGVRSEQILSVRQKSHLVVDRPIGLETHWAGSTEEFAARFGRCIVAFANSVRGIPPACQVASRDPAWPISRTAPARHASKSSSTPVPSGGSTAR